MAEKDSFGKLVGIVSILVACLGLFGAYVTPTSAGIIVIACSVVLMSAVLFEKIKPISEHERRIDDLDKKFDIEKRINRLQSEIDTMKGAMSMMTNKKGDSSQTILFLIMVVMTAYIVYLIFFQKTP